MDVEKCLKTKEQSSQNKIVSDEVMSLRNINVHFLHVFVHVTVFQFKSLASLGLERKKERLKTFAQCRHPSSDLWLSLRVSPEQDAPGKHPDAGGREAS